MGIQSLVGVGARQSKLAICIKFISLYFGYSLLEVKASASFRSCEPEEAVKVFKAHTSPLIPALFFIGNR